MANPSPAGFEALSQSSDSASSPFGLMSMEETADKPPSLKSVSATKRHLSPAQAGEEPRKQAKGGPRAGSPQLPLGSTSPKQAMKPVSSGPPPRSVTPNSARQVTPEQQKKLQELSKSAGAQHTAPWPPTQSTKDSAKPQSATRGEPVKPSTTTKDKDWEETQKPPSDEEPSQEELSQKNKAAKKRGKTKR